MSKTFSWWRFDFIWHSISSRGQYFVYLIPTVGMGFATEWPQFNFQIIWLSWGLEIDIDLQR